MRNPPEKLLPLPTQRRELTAKRAAISFECVGAATQPAAAAPAVTGL